jgi:hypothetical protein
MARMTRSGTFVGPGTNKKLRPGVLGCDILSSLKSISLGVAEVRVDGLDNKPLSLPVHSPPHTSGCCFWSYAKARFRLDLDFGERCFYIFQSSERRTRAWTNVYGAATAFHLFNKAWSSEYSQCQLARRRGTRRLFRPSRPPLLPIFVAPSSLLAFDDVKT